MIRYGRTKSRGQGVIKRLRTRSKTVNQETVRRKEALMKTISPSKMNVGYWFSFRPNETNYTATEYDRQKAIKRRFHPDPEKAAAGGFRTAYTRLFGGDLLKLGKVRPEKIINQIREFSGAVFILCFLCYRRPKRHLAVEFT